MRVKQWGVVALLSAFNYVQAATWTGGAGDFKWSSALNWDAAIPNDVGASAVFGGGTVTQDVSSAAMVGSLSFTVGTTKVLGFPVALSNSVQPTVSAAAGVTGFVERVSGAQGFVKTGSGVFTILGNGTSQTPLTGNSIIEAGQVLVTNIYVLGASDGNSSIDLNPGALLTICHTNMNTDTDQFPPLVKGRGIVRVDFSKGGRGFSLRNMNSFTGTLQMVSSRSGSYKYYTTSGPFNPNMLLQMMTNSQLFLTGGDLKNTIEVDSLGNAEGLALRVNGTLSGPIKLKSDTRLGLSGSGRITGPIFADAARPIKIQARQYNGAAAWDWVLDATISDGIGTVSLERGTEQGKITFKGTNTYSGGTVLMGGTNYVTGTLGVGSITVSNNVVLIFDRGGSVTNFGWNNNGTVILRGGVNLVLEGPITRLGTIIQENGTLTLLSGASDTVYLKEAQPLSGRVVFMSGQTVLRGNVEQTGAGLQYSFSDPSTTSDGLLLNEGANTGVVASFQAGLTKDKFVCDGGPRPGTGCVNMNSNYIECVASKFPSLAGTNGAVYTVAVWVKPETTQPYMLLYKGSSVWGPPATMFYASPSLSIIQGAQAGSGTIASKAYTPSADGWLFATYVRTNAATTFYANGTLLTPDSYANMNLADPSQMIRLGASPDPTGPYWLKGKLGPVYVFDRALSATEVNNLKNGELGTKICYGGFASTTELILGSATAVLDLNNADQTVALLAGDGVVRNGKITANRVAVGTGLRVDSLSAGIVELDLTSHLTVDSIWNLSGATFSLTNKTGLPPGKYILGTAGSFLGFEEQMLQVSPGISVRIFVADGNLTALVYRTPTQIRIR